MKKSLLLSLALMLCGEVALAQTTVSGTVVDSKGNPMPGAKVQVKGTNDFVITNMDGTFSVSSSKPKFKLVSDYVGWNTEVKKASEGVVIKMAKSSWWNEKPKKYQFFLGANMAFPGTGKNVFSGATPGFMLGFVKNVGLYVKGQISGGLDENDCSTWRTGKIKSQYNSASAGLIVRLGCPIYLYAGYGIMESKVYEELVCGHYAPYEKRDAYDDDEVDLGLMLRCRSFFVHGGIQSPTDVGSKHVAGNFGIGYYF